MYLIVFIIKVRFEEGNDMISLSPKLSNLLIQTTKANDIESALQFVLSEYIQMKIQDLENKRKVFESKWGGDFSEYQEKIKNNTLGKDPYSYEVESEYWEWEDTLTLLEHYESIVVRWFREPWPTV